MTIYDQLVSEAYIKFKHLLGYYKEDREPITMYGLLLGGGNYSVKANPDAPHNYQAVIDAVYRYYKENGKDPDAVEYYEEGLKEVAKYVAEVRSIQSAIEIFSYEMSKEKEGLAPFQVNMEEIISIFKCNLKEEYSRLINKKADADQWLDKQSAKMKADYGYSFWDN